MTVPAESVSVPATTPVAVPDEVVRLREEVAELRGRLERRGNRSAMVPAVRGVVAAICAALAAFALVGAVVGVWGARTVLNTDRWVAAVAPLPSDPAVAAAVAEYATTELFDVLDVTERLHAVLPPRAGFVAGPLSDQLRTVVKSQVATVLRSDRFQQVWVAVNRRAHQQAIAILRGQSPLVRAGSDRVTIDLLPLINQVLRNLSAALPTFFGHQLALPDLRSGTLPPNLRQRIQTALGVPLPANFAQFTVYDAGRLRAVQQTVVTLRQQLIALVAGAFALLLAALVIAVNRRRTVLQYGSWLIVAAVAITASLRTVRADLLHQVSAGVYRDGVAAALTLVTAPLRSRGLALIALGAALALGAYLVGPGRIPTRLRAGSLGTLRRAGATVRTWATGPGRTWTARHRDGVRFGGVIVAAGCALLIASWTGLLITAVALALFELAVTLGTRPTAAGAGPVTAR